VRSSDVCKALVGDGKDIMMWTVGTDMHEWTAVI